MRSPSKSGRERQQARSGAWGEVWLSYIVECSPILPKSTTFSQTIQKKLSSSCWLVSKRMQNTSGADQERKASEKSREGLRKNIKRISLEGKV